MHERSGVGRHTYLDSGRAKLELAAHVLPSVLVRETLIIRGVFLNELGVELLLKSLCDGGSSKCTLQVHTTDPE